MVAVADVANHGFDSSLEVEGPLVGLPVAHHVELVVLVLFVARVKPQVYAVSRSVWHHLATRVGLGALAHVRFTLDKGPDADDHAHLAQLAAILLLLVLFLIAAIIAIAVLPKLAESKIATIGPIRLRLNHGLIRGGADVSIVQCGTSKDRSVKTTSLEDTTDAITEKLRVSFQLLLVQLRCVELSADSTGHRTHPGGVSHRRAFALLLGIGMGYKRRFLAGFTLSV